MVVTGKLRSVRWRWVAAVLVLLVVLVTGVIAGWRAWAARAERDCWTRQKVDAAVNATLPLGSTRQQVEGWLEDHHIDNHRYIEHVVRSDFEGSRYGAYMNRSGTGRQGAVEAIIDESTTCYLIHGFKFFGDLYVVFFFDKDGRFTSHLVLVQEKYLRLHDRRSRRLLHAGSRVDF